jgi:hypothetical protein
MKMAAIELQRKGFKALVDALDIVDAMRFIHQYDSGSGDYTKECHQWLDQLTIDDFHNYVRQKRQSQK